MENVFRHYTYKEIDYWVICAMIFQNFTKIHKKQIIIHFCQHSQNYIEALLQSEEDKKFLIKYANDEQ